MHSDPHTHTKRKPSETQQIVTKKNPTKLPLLSNQLNLWFCSIFTSKISLTCYKEVSQRYGLTKNMAKQTHVHWTNREHTLKIKSKKKKIFCFFFLAQRHTRPDTYRKKSENYILISSIVKKIKKAGKNQTERQQKIINNVILKSYLGIYLHDYVGMKGNWQP